MRVSRASWLSSLLLLAGALVAHQSVAASDAKKSPFTSSLSPSEMRCTSSGARRGLTVMIQSASARGAMSPKLEGSYTPADALDRILAIRDYGMSTWMKRPLRS